MNEVVRSLGGGALHVPVMLEQVMALLAPQPGDRVFDGTVGLGGHSAALLAAIGAAGELYGVDRDSQALDLARRRLQAQGGHFTLMAQTFDRALQEAELPPLDAVLLDLGVSSMQLDRADRGFSFSRSGPLDMRMDPSGGITAAELVNEAPEQELSRIFSAYGEETHARRVARAIVRDRPFTTTDQLAASVARSTRDPRSRIHPATKVFQALRIAVNDELGALERALPRIVGRLAPGGRLAILTFHSLEDRIVKRFIRGEVHGCVCPPRLPGCVCDRRPTLVDLTPRPMLPSPGEIASNPRSRSAKLRGARKVS